MLGADPNTQGLTHLNGHWQSLRRPCTTGPESAGLLMILGSYTTLDIPSKKSGTTIIHWEVLSTNQ